MTEPTGDPATPAARGSAAPDDLVHRALEVAVAGQRLPTVAGLIRLTGDWELAADSFSDAVERALRRWPTDGVPDNPAAWLTTTAHRRALDVLRRRRTEADKVRTLAGWASVEPAENEAGVDPYATTYTDDALRLLFTCAHPALPLDGRVALTLRTVAGLSVRQIAQAFLVPEATMGKRLQRTRGKIAHAGIRFQVPPPHQLAERTSAVLAVVYLIYNAGYSAVAETGGIDLADEAIRLAEVLARVLPGDDEVEGLRALLLLQHSRRDARLDAAGELVPLADQDRSRWDREMIARGRAALAAARDAGGAPGWYRLQAEIAETHVIAPTAEDTDWAGIVSGYDALLTIRRSAVVALNRVVAIGFRDGPAIGLAELEQLTADGSLADYPLLPAVRADLLRRAGRRVEAARAYRDAVDRADTAAERRFLQRRLAEL